MPEAVECRLTADFLNEHLAGKTIKRWGFVDGKYADDPPPVLSQLNAEKPVVQLVDCHGKTLYFELRGPENIYYVIHSLRMTGRWQYAYDNYCKAYIEIENGEDLWFRDPRAFGTFLFTTDKAELDNYILKLGPDILTESFSLKGFKELTGRHKDKNITSFLMDQSIIAGIGNWIKAESLYRACISPKRKVGSLDEREQELLYEAIRDIPRIAYTHGGLTMRDYADHHGEKSEYERRLCVYGKITGGVERLKTPDGRTTYWNPSKQH